MNWARLRGLRSFVVELEPRPVNVVPMSKEYIWWMLGRLSQTSSGGSSSASQPA